VRPGVAQRLPAPLTLRMRSLHRIPMVCLSLARGNCAHRDVTVLCFAMREHRPTPSIIRRIRVAATRELSAAARPCTAARREAGANRARVSRQLRQDRPWRPNGSPDVVEQRPLRQLTPSHRVRELLGRSVSEVRLGTLLRFDAGGEEVVVWRVRHLLRGGEAGKRLPRPLPYVGTWDGVV
jgi:hypothetical protein